MLDEMGQPIKLDDQVIYLVPVMEMDGKVPQVDPATGEPRMYPQGIPLRNPMTMQPLTLDNRPVIVYPMLDPQ